MKAHFKRHPIWREIYVSLRDTWLLFREFQWPLVLFMGAIVGGGWLYYWLSKLAGEAVDSPLAAVYHILGLTFLQPLAAFPQAWYLQIFYFIMPIVGIGILAQGVADFGVLFFNRRKRGKEWAMAVASTFDDHVILVGLGHLGYRVAQKLHTLGQDVVVIEINPQTDLVTSVQDAGIVVLVDDGKREAALQAANIEKARSILLCTQNDSLNLQVALKARSLRPDIPVVIRIFDDDFADALQTQFHFTAISSTGRAAPVFAAAAAGVDMTRPITVEGESLSLASMTISSDAQIAGQTIDEVEQQHHVSVVLLRRSDEPPDYHPAASRTIAVNDTIAVLGEASRISALAQVI